MRRLLPKVFMIVAPLLLLSCDLQTYTVVDGGLTENTFLVKEGTETGPSSFSFLLFTDPHFTRKDSGVWYATEEFFDWLGNCVVGQPFDLAICLGDCTNQSLTEEFVAYSQFTKKLEEHNLTVHSVKGNHDIRQGTNCKRDWEIYVQDPTYQAFSWHGVSFYLLDTSARTLGRTQLGQLKKAVGTDGSPKIFCTHMPLYGKADLVYFCLPDTQEREEILETMDTGNVGIYLSGHQHFGNFSYRYTNSMAEFVACSFHGRNSLFETTRPTWYVCTYDAEDSELTIVRYAVKKNDRSIETDTMGTFPIPNP